MKRLLTAAVCVAAFGAIFFFVMFTFTQRVPLVRIENGVLRTSDFVYHLLMVDAFWEKRIASPYQPNSQLAALSAFTGITIQAAMPIGATPIMLLLWAPFSLPSRMSLELASSLWITISLALFAYSMLAFTRSCSGRAPRTWFLLAGFGAAASTILLRAVALGQPSIIACAALILLLAGGEMQRNPKPGFSWMPVPLMFILAVKPTYFIFGAGILLAYGERRRLAAAVGLISAALLLLTLRLGAQWPLDYAAQLGMYTLPAIPDIYAASIRPETTGTLSAVFWGSALYAPLLLVCDALLMGLFAVLMVFAWLKGSASSYEEPKHPALRRITPLALCCALPLVYLLIAPYAGAYEELLLLPPALGACAAAGNKPSRAQRVMLFSVLVLLLLLLNRGLAAVYLPSIILWALKLLFSTLVLHLCNQPQKASLL